MRVERFFIVNPDSKFYKVYKEYRENRNMVNKLIRDFFKTAGIETSGYFCTNQELYIEPTATDSKKFAAQLCAGSNEYGLRRFKKRSEINTAWIGYISDLTIISRPYLFMYLEGLHGGARLFFDDDTLYCSGDMEEDAAPPDGVTEIKGSEFFAVIEKLEAEK